MPDLGNAKINLLVSIYADAARSLAQLLEEMTISTPNRRLVIYQQVLRILRQLKDEASDSGRELIEETFKTFDERAIRGLGKILTDVELSSAWNQVNEVAVESLVSEMTGFFDKGLDSVKALASRIVRKSGLDKDLDVELRTTVARGLARGESRIGNTSAVRQMLRKSYKDGMVKILGSNGRYYNYTLDYYAGLVTHQTQRQAMTLATITRAQQNNYDLVRVSPNPSTVGDFCDFYAGKVFSITGSDSRFPALAELPNSGPPFHPFCKHSLAIFIPDFYDAEQLEEMGDVDENALLEPGEGVNAIRRYARSKGAE